MNKKLFFPIILMATLLTCAFVSDPSAAEAHRLNVFAWLKGNLVVVECNFGDNKPAINADVTILDTTNNRPLVRGKTGAKGDFTFTVPAVVREGHGLAIEVNAGQGHRNVWHMDAAELYEAAALTAGFEQAAIEGKNAQKQPAEPANPLPSPAPALQNSGQPVDATGNIPLPAQNVAATAQNAATPEHVRNIVREELENHVAPIRRQLAQASAAGPTFAEIVGGIGWIVGIIGIILYFKSRRRREL